MQRLLLLLVSVYRRWLSPLKGRPTCRFLPTCSEYAHEAISRDGAVRGSWKAARRLLRCHPFGGSGYDPP
jgi:putative membrane protein insertion efficiency factor